MPHCFKMHYRPRAIPNNLVWRSTKTTSPTIASTCFTRESGGDRQQYYGEEVVIEICTDNENDFLLVN